MRAVGALARILTALTAPTALTAQASIHFGFGARYTSTLVHDSIVSAFEVRPAIAPALALTASMPLEGGWTADAMLDLSWSSLRRHEGSESVSLGAVRTLAGSVALRHRLPGGLTGRAGVGGLKYLPASESGVFRDGTASLTAVGSLGLRYEAPFATTRGLAVEARYDLHRFITPALRSVGFPSPRVVHRLALLVSARVFRGRSGP